MVRPTPLLLLLTLTLVATPAWGGESSLDWFKANRTEVTAQDQTLCYWKNAAGEPSVAVTSLVLNAYFGQGHTHKYGADYKNTIKGGLWWLIDQQDEAGGLGYDPAKAGTVMDHILGTFALCEAYAISADFRLQDPVQLAVRKLVALRNPDGSWGTDETALLTTCFAVLALKAAKIASQMGKEPLRLADGLFTDAAAFLAASQPADQTERAGATLARLFCGVSHEDEGIQQALKQILAQRPQWSEGEQPDYLYAYFGSYALFMGRADWACSGEGGCDRSGGCFAHATQDTLYTSFHDEGELAGSVDPQDPRVSHWGRTGTTALGLLALEIHYRHQRVHSR